MISLQTQKILVIKSNNTYFGLDIDQMKEIFQAQKIVRLPRASSSLAGVVNLRGKIITVFDLKYMLWGKESPTRKDELKKYILLINYHERDIGLLVENIPQMINIESKKELSSTKLKKIGLPKDQAVKYELKSEQFKDTIYYLDIEKLFADYIDHTISSGSEEELIKTTSTDESDDTDDFDYDQFTLPD